jgi:hypothetical protein
VGRAKQEPSINLPEANLKGLNLPMMGYILLKYNCIKK